MVTPDPTIFCVLSSGQHTSHFDQVKSKSNVGKYVKKTCCQKEEERRKKKLDLETDLDTVARWLCLDLFKCIRRQFWLSVQGQHVDNVT